MGPTSSGKTALAIELVQRLPVDIISVDSAMVYIGMDIGTAKPSKEELALAPHRLIDICDPAEPYSAGSFIADAEREIKAIVSAGRVPLLVGGTTLYFHCLQQGVAQLPTADETVREKITLEAEKIGWSALHERLRLQDAKAAQTIHPNDAQRIQRALEIIELTGKPPSQLYQQQAEANSAYEFINLALLPSDRALLHARIAKRFQQMCEQGLVAEVEGLYQREDLTTDLPSMRSVGYRQVWRYLDGEYDYKTMQERGIVATRQLAKRQLTWLRSWENLHKLSIEDDHVLQAALKIIV